MRVPHLMLACGLLALPSLASAVQISNYTPQQHGRFYTGVDKAFIADGYDLSGVGRTTGGAWITMISPTYFLAAVHTGPTGSVTFQPTNVQGVGELGTIDSTFGHILKDPDNSDSDLYLGRLTSAVSGSIAKYSIPMLGPDSAYLGQQMFVYGRGNGGFQDSDRVGTNMIDELGFVEVGESPNTIDGYSITSYYQSNIANDTVLQGGDSGAPNFLVVNGQLSLVGVNWFTGYVEENPEQLLSGGSFVPFYGEQVQSLMATDSEDGELPTFVPEPASLALAAMGLIALVRHRGTGISLPH